MLRDGGAGDGPPLPPCREHDGMDEGRRGCCRLMRKQPASANRCLVKSWSGVAGAAPRAVATVDEGRLRCRREPLCPAVSSSTLGEAATSRPQCPTAAATTSARSSLAAPARARSMRRARCGHTACPCQAVCCRQTCGILPPECRALGCGGCVLQCADLQRCAVLGGHEQVLQGQGSISMARG